MPDISMCRNKKCPLASTCYRYLAKPSQRQSYVMLKGGKKCEYYIKEEK